MAAAVNQGPAQQLLGELVPHRNCCMHCLMQRSLPNPEDPLGVKD